MPRSVALRGRARRSATVAVGVLFGLLHGLLLVAPQGWRGGQSNVASWVAHAVSADDASGCYNGIMDNVEEGPDCSGSCSSSCGDSSGTMYWLARTSDWNAVVFNSNVQSTEVFQLWGLQNALTGDVGGVSPDHYRGHVYASAGKVLERADVTGNNVVTIASYELPETDIGMNGRCFVDHANRRLWVAYHSRTVGGDVNYNCGIGYYHLPADSGATFFEYVGSPDCTGATQGPQMSLYSAVAQSLWFEPRTRRLYWWSTGAVNYLPNGSERTGHAVVSIDVSDLTTAPEVYYQTSGGNGEIARAVTVMYLTGEGLGLRTRIFTATPSALYSGGHTYGDGSSERYTVSSRSYPGFRALCHDGSSYQRLVSTHDWYGSQGNQQQIRRDTHPETGDASSSTAFPDATPSGTSQNTYSVFACAWSPIPASTNTGFVATYADYSDPNLCVDCPDSDGFVTVADEDVLDEILVSGVDSLHPGLTGSVAHEQCGGTFVPVGVVTPSGQAWISRQDEFVLTVSDEGSPTGSSSFLDSNYDGQPYFTMVGGDLEQHGIALRPAAVGRVLGDVVLRVRATKLATGAVVHETADPGVELTIDCADTAANAAAGTDAATVDVTVVGTTAAQMQASGGGTTSTRASDLALEVQAQLGVLQNGDVTVVTVVDAIAAVGSTAAVATLAVDSPVALAGPSRVSITVDGSGNVGTSAAAELRVWRSAGRLAARTLQLCCTVSPKHSTWPVAAPTISEDSRVFQGTQLNVEIAYPGTYTVDHQIRYTLDSSVDLTVSGTTVDAPSASVSESGLSGAVVLRALVRYTRSDGTHEYSEEVKRHYTFVTSCPNIA